MAQLSESGEAVNPQDLELWGSPAPAPRSRASTARGSAQSAAQQRYLHAVVADAAVGAAGRAVEVAGGAPLHPYLDSFDLHVLVQRRAEVVVLILIFVCSWENSRVHESCHAEVCQHKQENESIVHWDGWGDGFCQPGAPVEKRSYG